MSSSRSPDLTAQQLAAITTRDVSVSLAAGAGCGKTFVLTRRFLSHLQPGQDVNLSGLVAITFTERAAREMRERIRDACFQQLRECEATDVPHWLELTREIDSARVSTIHAFCATILRSAAVEARLDPQFGLLDPQIGGTFLHQAVAEAIHAAIESGVPAAADVVQTFGLSRTINLCENLVHQRFEMRLEAWRNLPPTQLAEHWQSLFGAQAPALILQNLQASPVPRRLLGTLNQHTTPHAVMSLRRGVLIQELVRLLDEPATITDLAGWLTRVREHAMIKGGGTKKDWESPEIYEAVKTQIGELRKLVDKQLEHLDFDAEHVVPAARLSLQVLELVQRAIDQYELRKAEASVLDFDDLVVRTRNLLRDQPAVRRRIAAGIDFLMVDEFQDTDPIQADIVRDLCGSSLTTGKLFLVGDAQQSIYRFRRADPRVFIQLRQEIPEQGRLPLNRNFRSQPAILDFVNALFAGALGDIFQPLVPEAKQVSPEPAIEFLFPIGTDAHPLVDTEARRTEEAAWMARRIRELLDDPTPRVRFKQADGTAGLRPVRPGDIVILFRALSDVRYYESALRDCRLEYYLVGGRAFYAQQEVFDLLNLLRFLNEPDDEISLLGVLRSPFFGLTDDSIMSLARNADSLDDGLQQPSCDEFAEQQLTLVHRAREVLNELRANKDRLSIAGVIARILELTAYDASLLAEFLGRRKLANLRKLQEMARQFDCAGGYTLADFVERVKGAVAEEIDEELAATQAESSDVIRIMTIHQSKGLEFPVVILGDMDRTSPPPNDTAVFSPELGPIVRPPERFGRHPENLGLKLYRLQEQVAEQAEHLRLLYVALTRAADHLILSGSLKSEDSLSSGWMKLLASRFDLASGLPKLDAETGDCNIPDPYRDRVPPVISHRVSPRSPILPPALHENLPLRDFAEFISQAEPQPLPPLLQPLKANAAEQLNFSVSSLEVIDEFLRHGERPIDCHFEPEPDRENSASAEDVGTLVHNVLERVDFHSDPSQFDRLLDACWGGTFSDLPDEIRHSAIRMLNSFWDSPLLPMLRSARQCQREIEFSAVLPAGTIDGPARRLSGKIDCLLQDAQGQWTIIDYKTGSRFRGRSDSELLEHYSFQMGVYAWAVHDGLGQLPSRVAIVTFQPEVRIVDWAVSTTLIDEVRQRAARAIQTCLLGPPVG